MKPLEKARIQKGLTYRDVQKLTTISHSMINHIEKKRNYQTIDNTVKLSKGLNTSIDYIIGIEKEIKPLSDNDKLFIKRYEQIEKALKVLNQDVPPRPRKEKKEI